MRLMVLLLCLLPGCFGVGGPDCTASTPVAEGIEVHLIDFDEAVGECLELSNSLEGKLEEPVYALVEDTGVVWFPAPPPGTYWVSIVVSGAWTDDCGTEWFRQFSYEEGLVELELIPQAACP